MSLGEKIKYLRSTKGLSQENLANILKINRNYLSRIETGLSDPSSSVLIDIANFFDISIDSLLDLSKYKHNKENKIKLLENMIKDLDGNDIDFLIRIVSIMKKEFVKNI